jgi:hypothetical protein
MSTENVEAVFRATEAWNRDDYATWIAYCHPELEWSTALETYRGVAGAKEAWETFKAYDLKTRHSDVRDLGESVLALGEVTTVGPSTGLTTGSELGQVVTFRDARAIRIRDFSTHAEALEAAGIKRD